MNNQSLVRVSRTIAFAFVLGIVLLLLPLGMVIKLPTLNIQNGSVGISYVSIPIGEAPSALAQGPVISATITGPTNGQINQLYGYTVLTSPVTATQPISYVWSPAPNSGQGTEYVFYQWAVSGTYAISVTASNVSGTIETSHLVVITENVPLSNVTINGPANGTVNTLYGYSAITSPISATTPVNYIWSPAPNSGQGTATANYIWPVSGTYSISVMADNISSTVSNSYTVVITENVPLSNVTINGPANGLVNMLYGYSAITSPISATTPVNYIWSPAPTSGQGTATANYIWPVSGTYSISVMADNISSTVSNSYTVVITDGIVPLSNVTINGPANGTVNMLYSYSAITSPISATTPVNYIWSPAPNGGQGTANANYFWPVSGTYSISVMADNISSTVSNSYIVVITENVPLSNVTINGPTGGLVNTLYNYNATTSPISASLPVNITWSPPPNSGQGTANANYLWPISGTYFISVMADNISSTVSNSYTVVITDGNVALSGVTINGPASGNINTLYGYSAITSPISATLPVIYTWSPAPNSGQGTANANYQWATGGTYTVLVTAGNISGTVSASYTVAITMPLAVAPTAVTMTGQTGGAMAVPYNFTANLSPISATTPVTYSWQADEQTPVVNAGVGLSNLVVFTWNTTGTKSITVSADNGMGVVATTYTILISETSITGLTASNNGPTALGSATTLNASVTGGTNVVYSWDFGDGTTGSGAAVNHTYGAIGSYTATVTATNSVNTVVAATSVTINQAPIADVAITGLTVFNNGPTSIGDKTAFFSSIASGTNVSYSWNFGDGTTLGGVATPSHTYNAIGVYTVTVTASNSLGSTSASTIVVVQEAPVSGLSATNTGPAFEGNAVTLNATVTGGTGTITYTWNFGDNSSGSGATINHSYAVSGTYTATVVAMNSTGSATATTQVIINAASLTDTMITGLSATNDGPTQQGNPTILSALVTGGSNISYTWDFGDGTTGTGSVVNHSYANIGTYTATVMANNSANTMTASTQIVIQDVPISGLTINVADAIPVNSLTSMQATAATGNGVTYQWRFGDGTTGSGVSVSHAYANIGTYTIVVTATNSTGSQTSQSTIVVESVPAGLTASNNSPVFLGQSTIFSTTLVTGSNVVYQWNFGDGTSGNGLIVQHVYQQTGDYTVTVIASNAIGQVSADTNVTVLPDGGFISGIVASETGDSIGGVQVCAYPFNSGRNGCATTTPNGSYKIAGLDTGDYRLQIYDPAGRYLREYYDDKFNWSDAARIQVVKGQTTELTQISLSKAGAVNGFVTSAATGNPIQGIYVYAYKSRDNNGWSWASSARTDSNGRYTLGNLYEGTYHVGFFDWQNRIYYTTYYSGSERLDDGTDVVVPKEGNITGIDVAMFEGGHITGKVTNSAGDGLANMYIQVRYQANGRWYWAGSTRTDSNGMYDVTGLKTGSYRLMVYDSNWPRLYQPEYHQDATSWDEAKDVDVILGQTTSDVDIEMDDPGRISGKVTDDAGTPVSNLSVYVYEPRGNNGWRTVAWSRTDSNGNYTAGPLNTGNYRVGFFDTSWPKKFASVYYEGSSDVKNATDVTVTDGQETSNINVVLERPGTIRGQVTYENGNPVPNVRVKFYRKSGNEWQEVQNWISTDGAGNYEATGLPKGIIRVGFFAQNDAFAYGFYEDGVDLSSGKNVILTPGQTTHDINFQIPNPPPSLIEVDVGGWRDITVDPNTGEVSISAHANDVTIKKSVTCEDGSTPTNVTLTVVSVKSYPMTFDPVTQLYSAFIPNSDLPNGWGAEYTNDVTISKTCSGNTETQKVGTIFWDPSGLITDALTGESVEGATVTLYNAPDWLPKQAPDDNTPNTCQSHLSKAESDPWNQDAPTDISVVADPDGGKIDPATNPLFTNEIGHYAWDVAEGCWYVVVQAKGYQTQTSPVVGAPPEVTDLHLELVPYPTLQFSTAGYQVDETAGTAMVTVTVRSELTQTVSVRYTVSNNTAMSGEDYDLVSGELTFKVGDSYQTITIPIKDDTTPEYPETLLVSLSDPTDIELGRIPIAAVTINDNDEPTVQFSATDYQVNESAGAATITVTLNVTATQDVSVGYTGSDESANVGIDYQPVSGTLVISEGQVTNSFIVGIISDTTVELTETLTLTLSSPVKATLGVPATASLAIIDDVAGDKAKIIYLPVVMK